MTSTISTTGSGGTDSAGGTDGEGDRPGANSARPDLATDQTADRAPDLAAVQTITDQNPTGPTAQAAVAAAAQEPGRRPLTHRQVLTVLSGLLLALFVASLSATVVATALPTIVGQLGGQDKLSWVISATLLTTTASTPLWGKMSDLYGRKPLFMASIVVFVVASALAGLSQNIGQLIAMRALQGVGAGGLLGLSQAIMADIVSPRERGRYAGYLGGTFGLATVAGPLIGGVLVDSGESGWRWCFYVGIPVAVAALVVVQRTLHLPAQRRAAKVDYWGAATITGAVSALLVLLSMGGKEFAWVSGWTAALAALSLAFLLAAILIERRVSEPILPPRLFRDRTFVLASIASFFVGTAMFGVVSYLPLYLQIARGKSATVSGLLLLPQVVGLLAASIGSGQLISRLGRWKRFPIVGLVLAALGLYLLSTLHPDTSMVAAGLYMAVFGAGVGLTMQVLVVAVQNTVSRHDIGIATSSSLFFRSMGGAVGVAAFGAILNNRLTDALPRLLAERHVQVPAGGSEQFGALLASPQELRQLPVEVFGAIQEGFAESLHVVFLVGAPVVLLGWVAVLLIREVPLRTHVHQSQDTPAEPKAVVAD